jgi:hypothetical protein
MKSIKSGKLYVYEGYKIIQAILNNSYSSAECISDIRSSFVNYGRQSGLKQAENYFNADNGGHTTGGLNPLHLKTLVWALIYCS